MNDQLRLFAGSLTISPREEVSGDQLHLRARMTIRDLFQFGKFSGRPAKANQIAEAALEQAPNHARTDEPCSPGYKNLVIGRNDERTVLFRH